MKKGFTLVELLAVIVILAIILAIAIPGISNIIESSKKGAAENDVKMIIKAIDFKRIAEEGFDPTTVTEITIEAKLGISAANYERITVKEMNGTIYVTMVGKDKWEGITVSGTKKSTKINDTITTPGEVPNAPVLAPGMIPVYYDNGVWKKADPTNANNNWYKYGTGDAINKQWANAVTLNDTGTDTGVDGVMRHERSWYLSQPIGTSISIDDINTMWVWIPRYVYKISSGWHGDDLSAGQAGTIDIQFSKGVDDSWNGAIDLRETAYASKATGTDNNGNKYTNHPAFTFGDTELTGIWIAKFEATAADGVASLASCNASDDVNTKIVKIIPNARSWRCLKISNAFTVSRNMETDNFYGWGTSGEGIDTHLTKNTEWGAVTYLSKSEYGKNAEIWINNSGTFTTGCGGNNVSDAFYNGCRNAYNMGNGPQASTTGNFYGVYDMSGGAGEYMASFINNGHDVLRTNGDEILNADSKYKNVYQIASADGAVNENLLLINYKGDAVFETSGSYEGETSWYNDYSTLPVGNKPWFGYSGRADSLSAAGAFAYNGFNGARGADRGFRTVLLVGEGL